MNIDAMLIREVNIFNNAGGMSLGLLGIKNEQKIIRQIINIKLYLR